MNWLTRYDNALAPLAFKAIVCLVLSFGTGFFLRAQDFGACEGQDSIARNSIFAVKTNLLYDAVTALNVELEVPVGHRLSLVVEDVFPWWDWKNKYCFQMWEMGAEGRFWFKPWNSRGTEKLRGWFVGLYGMSARFDFQWDRSVNYQGRYWSAGVTGGWCTAIGKKKRINLELSLGLGYAQAPWQGYLPTDTYDKLIRDKYKVGTLEYWGPTKAKVSLVIPINVKQKKEVRHEN